MRLLLDTQSFLWLTSAPRKLSAETAALLADPGTTGFLSLASCWEIAIKYALGKMVLPLPPETYVPSRMNRHQLTLLPIDLRHVFEVTRLAHHHRDPFERMLIAQARLERLPILTADRRFDRYEVETLRA